MRLFLIASLSFACTGLADDELFFAARDVLAKRCVSCHNPQSMLLNGGGLSIETQEAMLKGGRRGSSLVPGNAEKSLLYTTTTLPENEPHAMPPAGRFARLSTEEKEAVKNWINAGAEWPNGQKITYAGKSVSAGEIDPDEMARVVAIREKIVSQAAREEAKEYVEKLDGVRVKLYMLPIPAGEIEMKGKANGDVYTAELSPFWMAKTEIPWDIYNVFMLPENLRDKDGFPQTQEKAEDGQPIILAQPSKPYHAMSFGMSVRRHPAIAMTHHGANKFCQWLSYQTGRFYRLPTEAEWEYAARAGVKTAYPWGDEAKADEANSVAWHFGNSRGTYQRLGKKQPNAWGLHDILGNVMEWTLDAHVENRKEALGGKDRVKNPWVKSSAPYPHVCKGGHWNAELNELAFSHKEISKPEWKISDPQNPKSIWYHTNIMWIGLRPVSPAELPSAEEMYHVWNSGYAYDEVAPVKQ